jgi:bla regulator protein blaR1
MANRMAVISAAAALVLTISVSAQTPDVSVKASFDVASIKPNDPNARGGGWAVQGDRQTIVGTTPAILIMSAYGVRAYELIGAPGWIRSERIDVFTTQPAASSREQLSLMMQTLLEERFA